MSPNEFNEVVAIIIKEGCNGISCRNCLLDDFKWDGDESMEGRLCKVLEDIAERE